MSQLGASSWVEKSGMREMYGASSLWALALELLFWENFPEGCPLLPPAAPRLDGSVPCRAGLCEVGRKFSPGPNLLGSGSALPSGPLYSSLSVPCFSQSPAHPSLFQSLCPSSGLIISGLSVVPTSFLVPLPPPTSLFIMLP